MGNLCVKGNPCPKCGAPYYVVPYCSKCGWYNKEFNRLSGGYLDHIIQFYKDKEAEGHSA